VAVVGWRGVPTVLLSSHIQAMVVCFVVRIRNLSSRTFYLVKASDVFYTTKVGGEVWGDYAFPVPPGFDLSAEGLVVPWSATSRYGLVVRGETSAETDEHAIRCVVGPSGIDDGGIDWLRLHTDSWGELAQEQWLALGKRHILGAIGNSVELTLTFRERHHYETEELGTVPGEEAPAAAPTVEASPEAIFLASCTHFERESACAPPNTVFLNVYDLASAASIPNAILCNSMMKSFGAFHATCEVYGEEWGFYRQPNPDDCGVCRSRHPRRHPVHVYRQSINLGETALRDWEVWNLIRWDVIPQWPSRRYDLLHSNCIHFADELSRLLGAKEVPHWVKGLHETGAALLRAPWPLNMIGGSTGSDDVIEEEEVHTPPAPRRTSSSRRAQTEPRPPTPPASRPKPAAEVLSSSRPDFLPEPLSSTEEQTATQSATTGRGRSDDGEDSGHSFATADPEEVAQAAPSSATMNEAEVKIHQLHDRIRNIENKLQPP